MDRRSRRFNKWAVIVLVVLLFTTFISGCGNETEDTTNLVNVGISWCEDIDQDEYGEDLEAYIDVVKMAKGNPILLPLFKTEGEVDEWLDTIDVLILTGGEDIDPSYYNEEPSPYLEEVNPERDISDFMLLERALERDMPILAICRGCQLLNVFSGGSLYQDIQTEYFTDILHRSLDEEDFEYHDILLGEYGHLLDIMGERILNVNSWHHQALKEIGDNLDWNGVAEDYIVESIERTDATFVMGVQFHPEWMVLDGYPEYLKIFEALIDMGR